MSIVFMLVIIGVVVAGTFLFGFIWSVKSGQYEDSYSPSVRILFDDHKESETSEAKKKERNNKNSKDSI
jgi:cbb3-type cytochrome oxidase maturation protein